MPPRPPRPGGNTGQQRLAGAHDPHAGKAQGSSATDARLDNAEHDGRSVTQRTAIKNHEGCVTDTFTVPVTKTRYQLHVEKWSNCTDCFLHQHRTRVVLARGKLPCDVLFVGEAPGKTEDVAGSPFVGPAGRLLDQIIERSVPKEVRYALTNLIACVPLNDALEKTTEPPLEAVEACKPRLLEIIEIASPRLIICVGKEAKEWLNQKYSWAVPCKVPTADIMHPAAILRANFVHQGLLTQKCIVAIGTALDDHLGGG